MLPKYIIDISLETIEFPSNFFKPDLTGTRMTPDYMYTLSLTNLPNLASESASGCSVL
jgi:hypothetical protein